MTPATSDLDFAVWTHRVTSFTATYPLLLFHEIDFAVNEGYRSIPYGGVEVGGLLFGHSGQTSARIEAFRAIECEHASGPSFVLSERDVSVLKRQLDAAGSDPELEGLEAIGWFISHTRRGLEMNDRESVLFDQFFPKPGAITLLVKPERFKPTLFGFLVRPADGDVARDAAPQAIILPLMGRAGQATENPVPSVPVPRPTAARAERLESGEPEQEAVPEPQPESPTPPLREPELEAPPPAQQPAPAPDLSETVNALALLPRKDLLSPLELAKRGQESYQVSQSFDARATHDQLTRRMREEGARSNARLAIVLFLAAALGCAVGYWGYLQLPSPTIPLRLRSNPPALIISWPPQQTRDAVYAAIRIDDSEPQPLSPEDRVAGQTQINLTDDNVKIELIAQHWMRDSRGIVRYVRASNPVPPPPGESKSSTHSRRHLRHH